MNFDKKALKKALLGSLRHDLEAVLLAAQNAHEGATHSEALAKSKYDTHGLELSYLAGSQYKRARVLEAQILDLERQELAEFGEDDMIDKGALVTLSTPSGIKAFYLLSEQGAGAVLEWENAQVQVISPDSLLGQKLLSLEVGDSFDHSFQNKNEKWKVLTLR